MLNSSGCRCRYHPEKQGVYLKDTEVSHRAKLQGSLEAEMVNCPNLFSVSDLQPRPISFSWEVKIVLKKEAVGLPAS